MARRQYVPPRGSRVKWQVTVLSRDGLELLDHAQCEDEKEVQAFATEARSRDFGTKILIRDTYGKSRSWD